MRKLIMAIYITVVTAACSDSKNSVNTSEVDRSKPSMTDEQIRSGCTALSQYAFIAALGNQQGIPVEKLQEVEKSAIPEVASIQEAIIREAYNEPKLSDTDARLKAAQDFGLRQAANCVEILRNA